MGKTCEQQTRGNPSGSASRQLARVRDLTTADRPHVGGLHCHHGRGMAIECRELHFEGRLKETRLAAIVGIIANCLPHLEAEIAAGDRVQTTL